MGVGLNAFFRETYKEIPGLKAEDLWKIINYLDYSDFIQEGRIIQGYRDGVILVRIPTDLCPEVRSRVVPVTSDTEFATICKSRVPGETPRKKTMALVESLPLAKYLTVVLYRADVLAEDNDRSTECDWEIVALLAQMDEDEPMNPSTLMANHFKADGGTDTKMDAVTFEAALRKSYNYWKNRSMGISRYEYSAMKAEEMTNKLEYRLRNAEGMDVD